MNCETCQERLVEFLLGELNEATTNAIERHLVSGCVACNEELCELNRSIDDGLMDVIQSESRDGVQSHARVRELVWQQIDSQLNSPRVSDTVAPSAAGLLSDDSSTDFGNPAGDTRRSRNWVAAVLAVACGFAVVSISIRFAGPVDPETNTGRGVDVANLGLSTPSAQFVSLRPEKGSPKHSGTLTYDPAARQVHFFAAGLSPPKDGEYYAIWFVTVKQEWIFGGKLQVTDGVAGQVFDLPPLSHQVLFMAITRDSETANQGTHGAVALVSDDVHRNEHDVVE